MTELTRKGVDRVLAQRVCAEADSRGVFDDAAWELGRRTARKTAGMDLEVRRRRLWSAGGARGTTPKSCGKLHRNCSWKKGIETSYTPGSVVP